MKTGGRGTAEITATVSADCTAHSLIALVSAAIGFSIPVLQTAEETFRAVRKGT